MSTYWPHLMEFKPSAQRTHAALVRLIELTSRGVDPHIARDQALSESGIVEVDELEAAGRLLSRYVDGYVRRAPPAETPVHDDYGHQLLVPDVRVLPVSTDMLRQLELDPRKLRLLSPSQFEELIADRFDKMGFAVQRTGRVSEPDGGIDLVAVPRAPAVGCFVMAVQVKHRQDGRAIGREPVDRLLAWRGRHFHVGALVTNTRFTSDAKWLAATEGNADFLRLRDFGDVVNWIRNNFGAERDCRELPLKIEVRPNRWIEVPRPKQNG